MKLSHLVGEVLDEKYRIEKQLGRGGMGAVYLATHLGTERPVALKVIAPEFMQHEEFVERFRREARAAGRLRHPNVVDVTDFGFARVGHDNARVAYLVMEYLDGCTLAEVLAEETSLPVGWVVDILEQTCSAVDEAHQQGIIHRDLKPDNIWLEPNGRGSYTVKVLDFGIARLGDPVGRDGAETAHDPAASSAYANSLEQRAKTTAQADRARTTREEAPTQTGGQASAAAQTRRQEAELTESATLMRPPTPVAANVEQEEEPSTLLLAPKASPAEESTRILEPRTTSEQDVASSGASTGSLTRVGSILGTPLYMSPEQCRGDTSDARSDIYSLGVIGYQMLAGQTPFGGNMETIITQHLTMTPPPLDEKRMPKKVARVIMSALAKNPEERPPTAAAFASALRAHSEGAGSLLRRAMTLFSEHLPVFLRLAIIVYSPLILLTVLQLVQNMLTGRGIIPRIPGAILGAVLSIINTITAFFVAAVIQGMTTRLVTQILAAPLRPLKLRPAYEALKRRLKPLTLTSMMFSFMIAVGMTLCFLPGLYILLNYYLVTPVVMMEEKRGRAAFRRAKELASRSRRTVVLVLLIQVAIPFLAAGVMAFVTVLFVKVFNPSGFHANIFNNIFQILFLPLNLLLGSFGAIVTALLYWKTRLAGGETLKEVLAQFEEEEMPDRNWQKRMKERLHLTTRVSRS